MVYRPISISSVKKQVPRGMQTLASDDLVFYLGFVVSEKLNTLILLGLYIIVFDLVIVFENVLSIGYWSKYSTYIVLLTL